MQQGIPWVELPPIIQREVFWSRAFRSASCTGHRRTSFSWSQLRHIVAAHLSERNNTPALARTALAGACGAEPEDIVVADPLQGFDWLDLR